MRKILLLLMVLLLLVSSFAFAAGRGDQRQEVLRFGLNHGILDPENDMEATWAIFFRDEIERNSNGAMRVEIFPNNQLGNAAERMLGVATGTIDMTILNSLSFAPLHAPSMILSAPGMFAYEAEIDAVMQSDWGREFFAGMARDTNLFVISAISNGMRCFTTSNRSLSTVDTARGVTFRVMENPLMVRMVEALGANAVPMAGAEMFTAMQIGTVDGQENPIAAILNDRTYEVQRYMVVSNHVASIVCFTMSYRRFQGLSPELQAIVLDAAREAGIRAAQTTAGINARGLALLRERGLIIHEPTPAELAEWHAPMRAAGSEHIRTQLGPQALDGLERALATQRGR